MATFIFTLQGVTPTVIDAADKIQFAGAAFDDAIVVDAYNTTTHVESSVGADDSSGNTPNNNKFISQAGGGAGDSQADWGDGTEDIDAILDAECSLKINFAHGSAVALTNVLLYAYDGATDATAPTGMDIRVAESGDTNFTEAEGSGSALALGDSGSSTSHDFFIIISASPTSVGDKTGNMLKMTLTYT